MKRKFDVVLLEKPFDSGLTKKDICSLCEFIDMTTEVLPIELEAFEQECSAMGFITIGAAEELEYDYKELREFVGEILDDMKLEKESGCYEFDEIKIWLNR